MGALLGLLTAPPPTKPTRHVQFECSCDDSSSGSESSVVKTTHPTTSFPDPPPAAAAERVARSLDGSACSIALISTNELTEEKHITYKQHIQVKRNLLIGNT
jgi:hypothetical protein